MDKTIKTNKSAVLLFISLLLSIIVFNLKGLGSDIKMYALLGLFVFAATIFIKSAIQGNIRREKVVFTLFMLLITLTIFFFQLYGNKGS